MNSASQAKQGGIALVHAPSETRIRDVLNSIVDPCSAAAGMPAGLGDMGLIKSIRVDSTGDSTDIHIELIVTHPMCLMAGVFINEARVRIGEIAGDATIHVELDSKHVWTPDDMDPVYRELIDVARARRREL